jgi:hypothetical protein
MGGKYIIEVKDTVLQKTCQKEFYLDVLLNRQYDSQIYICYSLASLEYGSVFKGTASRDFRLLFFFMETSALCP